MLALPLKGATPLAEPYAKGATGLLLAALVVVGPALLPQPAMLAKLDAEAGLYGVAALELEVAEEDLDEADDLVLALSVLLAAELGLELDQGAQVVLLEADVAEAVVLLGSADQTDQIMELELEVDVEGETLLGSADQAPQVMLVVELDVFLALGELELVGSADQAGQIVEEDEELDVDAGSTGHELEDVELLLGSADHGLHEVVADKLDDVLDELVLFGSTGQLPDEEEVVDAELEELTLVGSTGQPPWLLPSVERALLLEEPALLDEVLELLELVDDAIGHVPEDDVEEPEVRVVQDVLQVPLLYAFVLELELLDDEVLEVERVLLEDEEVDLVLVLDVDDEVVEVLLELFVDDDVELVLLEVVLEGVFDVVLAWQTDTPRLYSGVTQGYPVTLFFTVEVAVVRTETSVLVAPGFAIV